MWLVRDDTEADCRPGVASLQQNDSAMARSDSDRGMGCSRHAKTTFTVDVRSATLRLAVCQVAFKVRAEFSRSTGLQKRATPCRTTSANRNRPDAGPSLSLPTWPTHPCD